MGGSIGGPGKGGGLSAAIFTLSSSITPEGKDLLGLLFTIGVAPDPGANSLLGTSL